MTKFLGRFQFDGDMAGSAAAVDPLFWVAHGAVERLFQRAVFRQIISNSKYDDNGNTCSGHSTTDTKDWLEGYYFMDETVDSSSLTNSEIASILNPLTSEYRDLIPFHYDHSNWNTFCSWVSL